ncbi:MAG: hypothetical protein WBP29_13000 [Candidatus Zixiibacteriota bacterium]
MVFALSVVAHAEIPRGSVSAFSLGGIPNLAAPSALDAYFNPALACSSKYSLETSASRLFEMSDLDIASGAARFNFRRSSLGIAATQLIGANYYSERSFLVAASVSMHPRWRFGVGVEHQRLEFGEGYGSASATSFSLGLTSTPVERVRLAISSSNINRPRFDDQDDRLPLQFEIAGAFQANSSFSVLVAHHLDQRFPDRFSIGEITAISREFDLLLGLKTDPVEISGGFSLKLRGFSLEYGYANNVYLGGTHRVGLRYSH